MSQILSDTRPMPPNIRIHTSLLPSTDSNEAGYWALVQSVLVPLQRGDGFGDGFQPAADGDGCLEEKTPATPAGAVGTHAWWCDAIAQGDFAVPINIRLSEDVGVQAVHLSWRGGPSAASVLNHLIAVAPRSTDWYFTATRLPRPTELSAVKRAIQRQWGVRLGSDWRGRRSPTVAIWFGHLRVGRKLVAEALFEWIDANAGSKGKRRVLPLLPEIDANDVEGWAESLHPRARRLAFDALTSPHVCPPS